MREFLSAFQVCLFVGAGLTLLSGSAGAQPGNQSSDRGIIDSIRGLTNPSINKLLPASECPTGTQSSHAKTAVYIKRFKRGGYTLPEAIASAGNDMADIQSQLRYAGTKYVKFGENGPEDLNSETLIQSEDTVVHYPDQIFNPAFWEPDWNKMDPRSVMQDGGRYRLRLKDDQGHDISPSQAIQDIVDHPELYRIECATASKYLYYLAIIKHIGVERFDKAVQARRNPQLPGGLSIGPGVYEGILGAVMSRQSASGKPDTKFPGMASKDIVSKIPVGAAIYMINLHPTPGSSAAGLGGENMVYLGENQFYAKGVHHKALVSQGDVHDMLKKVWDPTPGPSPVRGPGQAGQQNEEPWFVDEYYAPQQSVLDKLGK